MNLSSDAKFGIGIILATILIIGGAAFFSNRNSSPGNLEPQVAANQDRLVREDDPVLGPQDAQVTIVEFGDFQCPACGALHTPLKAAKEQLAGESVRFVYRQFPLVQPHPRAMPAAQASLEAQAQGKFWEYHDLLFENQNNLEDDDLIRYAEQLELDTEAFRTALEDETHEDAVNQDLADGRAAGVNATPTVYINGVKYQGPFATDAITSAIQEALGQGSANQPAAEEPAAE